MNSDIKYEKNERIKEILRKIHERRICVGVIGLGYVGLPLAMEFAQEGVKTLGFEVDNSKVSKLVAGENYIEDVDDKVVRTMVESEKFTATSDTSRMSECDAVFICVPTPFTENKDPDIRYILDAAKSLADNLKPAAVVILKSTTFPGTTENYVMPILNKPGRKINSDYFLAFSPERIDPGNKKWNTQNTPITVGGVTPESTEIAAAVINIAVQKVVKVSSPAIAEMEKLLENIFRSVNIALVNEMAQLCDRIGVNIWEVVDAAATKPFGYMPFYPGPGIGGHCILIDPYYLAWLARKYDFVTDFITLAAETNEDMPFYVRDMVIKEIAKQPIIITDAKVLILGMAFKKNVNDLRHSPALKVFELLDNEGMNGIEYYDPYVQEVRLKGTLRKSVAEISPESLKKYDVVLITTDHSVFDFEMIAKNSKVVIDTRNALKDIKDRSNIVLLGDGK
ncbi:MAG: nucleotide sugar dehydrogenase [Candidatus Kapabacteria bacterium]|nr:nucleotide sugar dehydrogenase [Candidatus Kapabacteria bacterium]